MFHGESVWELPNCNQGLRLLASVKLGGVRFSAPKCSSFVNICVGKTKLI